MKSLVARQKACLHVTLASLNNSHSSDLHACCVSVRSSSRPNFVPIRPLRLQSPAWRSSFIANLNNTAPGRALVVEVEAHVVVSRCHVATMTLARSLIWPCNNFVLSRCTIFFSISPSLALKPVKCRLSLRSSCLGTSARVSIA